MTYRKKLIEVALPLEKINAACAREKAIRHGHPSTLHLWWARRPLAAARAVIFSQMVDDPTEYVDVLRADPKLHRKAETALKARQKLWEEARSLADKARGTGLQVPEPGPEPTLEETLADQERQRLFRIIEDLVKWEGTTDETVLRRARDEIWASWRRTCLEAVDDPRAKELFDRHELPAFHDPFAGGGALTLEAQRLGLESYASDLNPVAVLINKAMIEIPPGFSGQPPVNGEWRTDRTLLARELRGAQGLAEDVRYYGKWMRDEAERRIGHLYPSVEVTSGMARERQDLRPYVGRSLTVIAWLWARTVRSPNPAFSHVEVPLASTFLLAGMAGREAYVEPVIQDGGYRFTVKTGNRSEAVAAKNGTKLSRGANFSCLMSGSPIEGDYIKAEGRAGRMGARLMAIVAEGDRGRVYLAPTPEMEAIALTARPTWKPDTQLPADPRSHWTPPYGLTTYGDLFTNRQLVALTTFADLVLEAREQVQHDALAAGLSSDPKPLRDGGRGAPAYADAVGVYLGLAMSRFTDRNNSLCSWDSGPAGTKSSTGGSARTASIRNLFSRQAVPMAWDFAEANPFSDSGGSYASAAEWIVPAIRGLPGLVAGHAETADAATQSLTQGRVVSTDPPYYDNIGYADLSDFFYVWLRRSLRRIFPDLFATLAVPKAEELVATPYRHGSKEAAETFFLDGMTQAMHRLAEQSHPAFPVTIYYAFKQAESDGADGTTNTGWDTFLAAVIRAGFAVTGTWPMRTELGNRMIGSGTNALASSIVIVCRPQRADAATATRREYAAALRAEMPAAVADLQRGSIAPVDLSQAAVGPGMAIFTRYLQVLDAQGRPLSVSEAIAMINATLDEVLAEQEGDFDPDTRWALAWFEHVGFEEGEFGIAETLSKAKVTSVAGMVEAGIVAAGRGKVRLLRPDELPADWNPATDSRLTAWEVVHHLVRASGGANGSESAAAELVAKLGARAEVARELAYRLFALSDRKKRYADAQAYNGLIQSWPEITRLAHEGGETVVSRPGLFDALEDGG